MLFSISYPVKEYGMSIKIKDTSWLLKLAWPQKKLFVLATAALIIAAAINLAVPAVIRYLLNYNQGTDSVILLDPIMAGITLLVVFIIQSIAFYLRTYWFGLIGQNIVFDIRAKLFKSILAKPIHFFDKERVGDLISRLNADTQSLQDALSIKLSVCLRYSLQVIAGVCLMVYLSPKLTLAIVMFLPLLVFSTLILGKKLKSISKDAQHELGSATATAEDAISGIRVVKAFVAEELTTKRFENILSRTKELGIKRSAFAAFFSSLINLLMNLALVFVMIYGLTQVETGELSAGDLTAFLLYGAIVAVSFALLAGGMGDLFQASGSAARIREILDSADEYEALDTSNNINEINSLEFKKVSFRYPERSETVVLNDFSFSVTRGQLKAIVGASGAGKSTIVSLILRFYEPNNGQILVNGANINTFSKKLYRSHIAYVPQEPFLFSGTIKENLLFANENADQDSINKALQKASLIDFIATLPSDIDTVIGEKGIMLSGGQKQRLALARALLTNPDLVILDEATSALDSENESIILESLNTIKNDCAIIAIAHRLSTIQGADEILVLKSGKLEQSGTHADLIKQTGLYRDFVSYQSL